MNVIRGGKERSQALKGASTMNTLLEYKFAEFKSESSVASAVTVALHHLVLWLFLPRSVFNYEAQWWVVLVHAAFVVLETIAACYISREFFDNVIGLPMKSLAWALGQLACAMGSRGDRKWPGEPQEISRW